LNAAIPKDLETIRLKYLEKDRRRRLDQAFTDRAYDAQQKIRRPLLCQSASS